MEERSQQEVIDDVADFLTGPMDDEPEAVEEQDDLDREVEKRAKSDEESDDKEEVEA